MTIKKHLSFTALRQAISTIFSHVEDFRQSEKIKISLHDVLASAFACMYFQDSSLLQFQKRLEDEQHKNNLKSLFGVQTIPKETQMRHIIDQINSDILSDAFKSVYLKLQRAKYLERYQIFPKQYYFPIDGSQFYSSKEIHCDQCLVKHSRSGGKPTYSHQVLQGGIMHPDCKEVIPFMPEQIVNSDGATKQDCEMTAAKRFVRKIRKNFPQLGLVIGGDALFSKEPIINDIVNLGMHYIFVAKPSDHRYLFDWVSAYSSLNKVEFIDDKERIHCYEWVNKVPLTGKEKAVQVNFFRCNIRAENKKGEFEIVYKNSWVTDQPISKKTIKSFVRAGRCRWKNENEVFNTLKNQGYYMERNYGHGKQHLAFNFYLLTLLAFLFHQVLEMSDELYQACRKKFGSKRHFWETLRSYIKIIIFETWESVLRYALNPVVYEYTPPE